MGLHASMLTCMVCVFTELKFPPSDRWSRTFLSPRFIFLKTYLVATDSLLKTYVTMYPNSLQLPIDTTLIFLYTPRKLTI
jgi:hypothetical protein